MECVKTIRPVVIYQTSDYHLGDGICMSVDTESGLIHVHGVYDCNMGGLDDLTLDFRDLIRIFSDYNPELLL